MSSSSVLLVNERSKAKFDKVINSQESWKCYGLMLDLSEPGHVSPDHSDSAGQVNQMYMVNLIGNLLNTRFPGSGSRCVNLKFEFLFDINDGDHIQTTIELASLDPDKHIATCNIECINQKKDQVIIGTAAMILRK